MHADNLAANFSRELADYIIYVIDVAGGDKVRASSPLSRSLCLFTGRVPPPLTRAFPLPANQVPRKGGPGITQSDLLVINKTDLAEAVGADLGRMKDEAHVMRGEGPVVMAQVKYDLGVGEIVRHILNAWRAATGIERPPSKKTKKEGEEAKAEKEAPAVAAEA